MTKGRSSSGIQTQVMMNHLILLYGTPERTRPNHYIIQYTAGSSRYLGKAVTVDKWPLIVTTKYNIPFLDTHREREREPSIWVEEQFILYCCN